MTLFLNKYYHFVVITAILTFHGINNYIWLRLNGLPPHDDSANHLMGVLDILALSHNIVGMLIKSATFIIDNFYPPLFHSVMAIFNLLFGISEISSIMANMPFMLLLLLSLYYIGKKMGNKNIGILSGFILMMYPYMFDLSRLPLPDFAMTAMISLSICLLLYTEDFSNLMFSLLFGISCGLGMLTKQVFAAFIVGPLVYAVCYLLIKKRIFEKKIIINLLVSSILAFITASYWYIPKLGKLLPKYIHAAQGGYIFNGIQSCPDVLSFKSITYNFHNLIDNQMLFFFFLLFVAGLMLWFFSRGERKLKIMFLVSIIVPYIIFIFILTKHPKTTTPYLMFFSLISAAGILSIKSAIVRRGLVMLTIVFSLLQYFDVSYKKDMFFSYINNLPFINVFSPKGYAPQFRLSFQPQKSSSVSDEILSFIGKESLGNTSPLIALSYETTMRSWGKMNCIIANFASLKYIVKLKNLPYSLCYIEEAHLAPIPDFVVTVDNIEQDYPKNISDKFVLIKTFVLNDNSLIYIYKHI